MSIQKPNVNVGDAVEVRNYAGGGAGGPLEWKVQDVSSGQIRSVALDGSHVTRDDSFFSPALEWDDGGEQGTSVVDWKLGALWPLDAGNKAYFHRIVTMADGTSNEENWRCDVEGPETLTLRSSGSEHEAYKITCVSEHNIHIWYWALGMSTPVRYVRTSPDGTVLEDLEAA